jgi:hypothetical protein
MRFDEHGWAMDPVQALPADRAYAVLSPETSSRFDEDRLASQALTFFKAGLRLKTPKQYEKGEPTADVGELEIRLPHEKEWIKVTVTTLPVNRAPEVLRAAIDALGRIGDQGMGALVQRAKRVWQVELERSPASAAPASLLASAVFASVLLGPILPPGERTLFAVKTARSRLGTMGVRL